MEAKWRKKKQELEPSPISIAMSSMEEWYPTSLPSPKHSRGWYHTHISNEIGDSYRKGHWLALLTTSVPCSFLQTFLPVVWVQVSCSWHSTQWPMAAWLASWLPSPVHPRPPGLRPTMFVESADKMLMTQHDQHDTKCCKMIRLDAPICIDLQVPLHLWFPGRNDEDDNLQQSHLHRDGCRWFAQLRRTITWESGALVILSHTSRSRKRTNGVTMSSHGWQRLTHDIPWPVIPSIPFLKPFSDQVHDF